MAFVAYRSRYKGAEQREVFRILLSLWLKITFGRYQTGPCRLRLFEFEIEGSSYPLLLRLFKELFLAEPYSFVPATDNPLILDAGANIGMAVLYFKKQFPQARILAFEPNPAAFELLSRNVTTNNLQDVQLYQVALAAEAGELLLYTDGNGASLTASLQPHAGAERAITVPARRLADYLDPAAPADLLKLDVEGAEAAILTDLSQAGLLRSLRRCIVEYHYPIGTAESVQLTKCLQSFEQQGFSYFIKQAYPRTVLTQEVVFELWQLPPSVEEEYVTASNNR